MRRQVEGVGSRGTRPAAGPGVRNGLGRKPAATVRISDRPLVRAPSVIKVCTGDRGCPTGGGSMGTEWALSPSARREMGGNGWPGRLGQPGNGPNQESDPRATETPPLQPGRSG